MIIINPEYAESVPALSKEEYEALKQSIKEQGQHLPIIVNKDLVILDGHHRFKICQELDTDPKYEIREFPTKLHEQLYAIEINLQRRHLTPYVRGILALKSKPILESIARRNQGYESLRQNSDELKPMRVDEEIGKRARVSRDTIRKIEFIECNGTLEVKQKLCEGKTTVSKEYKKIQIQQKRQQLIKQVPTIDLPDGIQLFNQDFRNVGPNIIPNNSIDLLFTDPPYGAEYLDLYEDLGKFANRVLKDGGSLVTFVGQHNMIKIGNLIQAAGLSYLWPICVKHSGHFAKARLSGTTTISIAWKPMLWFVKGEKASLNSWLVDYIESSTPDKVAHDWQQSTVEADHLIRGLTVENQIVLDPFMGSGTTEIAAIKLNRKFIGIEIDKEKFEIAKHRIYGTIQSQ